MKVSVIIPAYDEEMVIGECLKSLSKQSYKNTEVIVVDDGSTDKTLEKVSLFTNHYSLVTVLRQKHLGAGAARNLGVKKATGDILVFVDADMTFDKNFISKLIKPIIQGEAIGTFSKDEYLTNKDNVWARCWNINRGFPSNKMHADNYPDSQKVFRAIKREDFLKVGGFNEKAGYTDDWSLVDKLGVEAITAPDAIFYHKNPETLSEVFTQSRWMAKRRYKLGVVGSVFALFRVSFPVSVVIGLILAINHQQLVFIVFKLVSDLGQFIGILEYVLFGKVSK
ncbi:MAG: glycosyltransferase family 2 protein [Patescibacteria group bacterium]